MKYTLLGLCFATLAKNDVAATAAALGTIVGGCNDCHSEFRR